MRHLKLKNLPGLLFCLGSCLFFQNCSGGFEAPLGEASVNEVLELPDAEGPGGSLPEAEKGRRLYAANCASCHGEISVSNKRLRTPAQISNAIETLSYMKHLRLGASEIDLIAGALGAGDDVSGESCEGRGDADTTAVFRLNKNEYVYTVADLFGSPASVADNLPPENSSGVFLNEADLLSKASPAQIESYLDTAEKVVAELWTRNKALVLTCSPQGGKAATCARSLIDGWGLRVFRRPVTSDERDRLLAMVDTSSAVSQEKFEAGIQSVLKAMLFSPSFLYRTIASKTGVVSALSDDELASRLSYFIWSSTPDAELLQRAKDGQLKSPSELRIQVKRMLADPKAKRLTENFAKRWFGLSRLAHADADASVYPHYKSSLKAAFEKESTLFFDNLVSQNLNLLDILEADYSFLNAEIAAHYGIPGVSGSQFRKVSLASTARRGLLSQGSVLMMTSHPDDSSVITRGKWVMENLMCDPPPPPPPSVPSLPGDENGLLTKRERLEAHRNNAACFSCHSRMEPLGFGLENFDAIGGFRTMWKGSPVDNEGELPDGNVFRQPAQLAEYLKTTKTFQRCASEKLLSYALGRKLTAGESCDVKAIAEEGTGASRSLSDTIEAIVRSDLFGKVKGR